MSKSKIEWCDHTINPIVGCSKCSPGCDNCYAEKLAARWAKHPNPKIARKYAGVVDEHGKWNGKTAIAFDGWESSDQLHDWMFAELPKKPSRIFVGSMGDIFHESVEQEWLEAIWEVMRISPQHTFMLLTKREKQLYEWAHVLQPRPNPLPNVWLGVTVCGPDDIRKIEVLLQSPATKRFVSIEPMLGQVDLRRYLNFPWYCTSCNWRGQHPDWICSDCGHHAPLVKKSTCEDSLCLACGEVLYAGYGVDRRALGGYRRLACPWCRGDIENIRENPLPALDWVIVGGETGVNARPMAPEWPQGIRDLCRASSTPFFFKGWGEWAVYSTPADPDAPPAKLYEPNMYVRKYPNAECSYRKGVNHSGSTLMHRTGKRIAGNRLYDRTACNSFVYQEFPGHYEGLCTPAFPQIETDLDCVPW